jgi:hypothetical protein
MPGNRKESFNKEKAACLASLLLLAVSGYYLFRTAPAELVVDRPITTQGAPPVYAEPADTGVPSTVALANERKSPFTPSQYKEGVGFRPVVGTGPVVTPVPPPPAPVQPKPPQQAAQTPKPSAPEVKEPPVEYVGVVNLRGQTYGLLKLEDGSMRRVKAGDVLEDLNCSVTRIDKVAILVQNEEGQVFIRKNDRLSTGSAPPAQQAAPSKAPADVPQGMKPGAGPGSEPSKAPSPTAGPGSKPGPSTSGPRGRPSRKSQRRGGARGSEAQQDNWFGD